MDWPFFVMLGIFITYSIWNIFAWKKQTDLSQIIALLSQWQQEDYERKFNYLFNCGRGSQN